MLTFPNAHEISAWAMPVVEHTMCLHISKLPLKRFVSPGDPPVWPGLISAPHMAIMIHVWFSAPTAVSLEVSNWWVQPQLIHNYMNHTETDQKHWPWSCLGKNISSESIFFLLLCQATSFPCSVFVEVDKIRDKKLLCRKTSRHQKDGSCLCGWLQSEVFTVSPCPVALVEQHTWIWVRGDLKMHFCRTWLVCQLDGIVLSELSVYEYINL